MSPTIVRRISIAMLLLGIVASGCSRKQRINPVPTPPAPVPAPVKPTPKPEPVKPADDDAASKAAADAKSNRTASDLQTVYFALDSDLLTEDAKATLDRDAAILRQSTSLKVSLDGYCDERGTEEYNLALSERRANRVLEYFKAAGLEASRFSVRPFGKQNPVDNGHDETAWSRNRRVEFK